jgi:hypothetical protein
MRLIVARCEVGGGEPPYLSDAIEATALLLAARVQRGTGFPVPHRSCSG